MHQQNIDNAENEKIVILKEVFFLKLYASKSYKNRVTEFFGEFLTLNYWIYLRVVFSKWKV